MDGMEAAFDATDIGVLALETLSALQSSTPDDFEEELGCTIMDRDVDRLIARDKYDWMKVRLLIYAFIICRDMGASHSEALVYAHYVASGCARGILAPTLFPVPDQSTAAGRVYHKVMRLFPQTQPEVATDADWEEWIDSM